MRISRRRGVVRLFLDEVEVGLLRTLFDDLADAIDTMDGGDPVRQRLFPAGYRDDVAAAAEFRDLTEAGLVEQRAGRIGAVRADLPAAAGVIALDADGTTRWLTVLNDLRLAIGTRLGVDADGVAGGTGHQGEEVVSPAPAQAVYDWLTALQDRLVESVLS